MLCMARHENNIPHYKKIANTDLTMLNLSQTNEIFHKATYNKEMMIRCIY